MLPNQVDDRILAAVGGPSVACDQAAVLAHQRRRRPAPLLDARGDRGDLGIRVGPCNIKAYGVKEDAALPENSGTVFVR